MRSVTTTMSLMPASSASKTASRVNAGGTATTDASTRVCCIASRTVSNPGAPRRDAADDLGPEVEALARHAHRLAARDALDDECGVFRDQYRHCQYLFSHGGAETRSNFKTSPFL